MGDPAISVLMTSYNRARYIAESIESVLAQTYGDFELVISDNCSTDGTADIARHYAACDPRIRVSVNERNIGQFPNRYHAATLARGAFLKYHDSDDVMYAHCLATMLAPLQREPAAAFALTSSHYWPGGACPMLLTPSLAYEREYLGSGLFHLSPSCALFRARDFRALGGFPDAGVASDYLFWLRACATVNVLLVPGDLFYYRVHAGQELADAKNDEAYARATEAAWTMLNSSECPLQGEDREQAKRNLAYTVARGAFRHLRRRRPASAAACVRYAGLGVADWLRYLRRPRRRAFAGTPTVGEHVQR